MKILTEINNPGMENAIIGKIEKSSIQANQSVSNSVINVFNEQVYLSNQFKQKIKSEINLIEFTYADDRAILKKTIDLFLETFDKKIKDYKETGDFVKFEMGSEKVISKSNNHIYEFSLKQNDQWMKDWMDQTSIFKVDFENKFSIDNDPDCFCYYVDVT